MKCFSLELSVTATSGIFTQMFSFFLRQEYFLQNLAEKLHSLPHRTLHKRKSLDWALSAFSPPITAQKHSAAGTAASPQRLKNSPSAAAAIQQRSSKSSPVAATRQQRLKRSPSHDDAVPGEEEVVPSWDEQYQDHQHQEHQDPFHQHRCKEEHNSSNNNTRFELFYVHNV